MLGTLLLAAACTFTRADADAAHAACCDFVSACTPRDAGTIRGRLAANWLLDRVSRMGFDAEIESFRAATPDGVRSFANVYVVLPGASNDAPWIVFVSHFDTMPNVGPRFEGANDGASTSGLLVALADAVRRAGPHPDNVALVWTDGEEAVREYRESDGLQGARRAVETFKQEKRTVKAVIGLDMLGDKDLHVTIPLNGHPALRKIARIAAEREGLGDCVSLGKDAVLDDFSVFHAAGMPAIDLIDFSYGPDNAYWHTEEDRRDKISAASLHVAGRLAVAILNVLERRR